MNDFRNIWMPFADRFYRAAYYMLESPQDAEDAVQELYLRLWKSRESLHGNSFERKVSAILDDAEKIIEVKDGGDSLNVYGTMSKKGDRIEDLVIFIPEDCAMICLFGSISTDKIAELVKVTNE